MIEEDAIKAHPRKELAQKYEAELPKFQKVLTAATSILERVLPGKVVVAVTGRIKEFDSFYEKSNSTRDGNLKYNDPLNEITDLVGIRIVVIAQRHISDICSIVHSAMSVIEEEDKAAELLKLGRLGYESYHFICNLGEVRSALNEYRDLCGQAFEIQVRTALQHAWAENEHRIQYKKSKNPELQKRFLRLAAAISSADEEFDRIYEINERIQENALEAGKEAIAEVLQENEVDENEDDAKLSEISLLFGKKPSDLIAEGRHSEAVQVYDRFIDRQPNQITHYIGRAKARALAGDIEGGLADLRHAEEQAPNYPATRSLRRFFVRLLRDVVDAASVAII